MKVCGIIVAGGYGKRMGTDVPKQLLKIDGIPIIERTLIPFVNCPDIDSIIIVAAELIFGHIKTIMHSFSGSGKSLSLVNGGLERQDSVLNGLEAVPVDTDVVVIHDAVRPFITTRLISECVHSARTHGAATVMRPVKETVKIVDNLEVVKTIDRSSLWITQTPQAFKKELILKAHLKARAEGYTGTDDCILVERLGNKVHVIEGSDMNIKITTPADLMVAETLLLMFNKTED